MKKYLIFIGILFLSCNKCPVVPSGTEQFEEVSLGLCLANNLPNQEYIINNDSEYKKLQSIGNCTTQQVNINFSNRTLLGKFTSGKCQMTVKKSVVIDKINKTYTYYLGVCEKGLCKSLAVNMNWITVKKLESGYTVKFVVEKK